ncbi:MAG TPA: glycosyltransferase family 87 protein, partial [Candidatus Limnocylindrales bacterium]
WRVPMPSGLPLVPVWASSVAILAVASFLLRRRLEPVVVLAAMALVAGLLFDATFFEGVAFRDLGIYLRAGLEFRTGQPVYLTDLVRSLPADPTAYPYLYPPPTLPFAAALSLLPSPIVTAGWEALLLAATLGGMRLVGLGWGWTVVLLAWPPFAQGLYVGNVALPLFFLFAAGPVLGGSLLVGALLKPQSAIAGLWLVRERRWRAIGVAIVVLAGLALVTLPITGIDPWRAWLDGLSWFSRSQPLVPRTFYGLALAEYEPGIVAVGVAVAVLLAALLVRGRRGLARLGVASVVASPSLYAHGFTIALPALLELRALAFWTAIAITSVAGGLSWFAALAIVAGSWFLPILRRSTDPEQRAEDELHPFAGVLDPWPAREAEPDQ